MDHRDRREGGHHHLPPGAAHHDGYAPSHQVPQHDGNSTASSKRNHEGVDPLHSMIHFGLTLLHLAVTLVALVFSIWIAFFAFGSQCNNNDCKSMIYITNTFYSTNKIGSLSGWAVATERAQLGEVVQYPIDRDEFSFSHYFECMDTAEMADSICGNTDSLISYTVCLKNNTMTNAALTACNALSTSLSQPWPTSEEYLQCLFRFPAMHNSVSLRASQNVFRACLAKSMWPFFEVQQGIDTPLFLGSFNWLIMLAVGLLCMTSFAVYTASPWEKGKVNRGEPTYHMRMGTLWTSISTLWILVFLICFFTVALRDGSTFESDGLPTTTSTSVISIFVLSAYLFYFGSELLDSRDFDFFVHAHEYVSRKYHGYEKMEPEPEVIRHGHVVHGPVPAPEDADEADPHLHQESQLGVPLGRAGVKVYTITAADVAKIYTPALLPAWADGYFADPCIFLGIAGASGHLTTDQAWNIFLVVFMYRFLNMLIARFMYQCFMNNVSLHSVINNTYHSIVTHPQEMWKARRPVSPAKGDGKPHLNIQVMALSTQIAAIFLFAALCVIVFNPDSQLFESSIFFSFFLFGFLIPEILRILGHVVCQIWKPDPDTVPWKLLNFYFLVWIYDLAVRVGFISFVVLSLSSDPGTRRYLMEKSITLMDTYLKHLGVDEL